MVVTLDVTENCRYLNWSTTTDGEFHGTQRDQLKVPTNRITGILNGQRAISGDTALRLAHFFGSSAEFWLNLQKLYELRLAEQKAGATIKRLPKLAELPG